MQHFILFPHTFVAVHLNFKVMVITNILAFIGDLGGSEILLILVVILLLFGAKRIPELARGLGKGINEFKNAAKEVSSEITTAAKDDEKTVK